MDVAVFQAALGEVKNNKGAESVPLRLKIDDGKFVLGTLAAAARPQITFDLVFEKEFELSHDWKNGSVYFCGYTANNPDGYPSTILLFMFSICLICSLIVAFFFCYQRSLLYIWPGLQSRKRALSKRFTKLPLHKRPGWNYDNLLIGLFFFWNRHLPSSAAKTHWRQ